MNGFTKSRMCAFGALILNYGFFTVAATNIVFRSRNHWLIGAVIVTMFSLYIMPLFCACMPKVLNGGKLRFRRTYRFSRWIYRLFSWITIAGFISLQLTNVAIFLSCIGTVPSSWPYVAYLSWRQIKVFYLGAIVLFVSIWGIYIMPWISEFNQFSQIWSTVSTDETRSE